MLCRVVFFSESHTVGTKIIADPERCFYKLASESLLNLLQDRPSLEMIIVSSNFLAGLGFVAVQNAGIILKGIISRNTA